MGREGHGGGGHGHALDGEQRHGGQGGSASAGKTARIRNGGGSGWIRPGMKGLTAGATSAHLGWAGMGHKVTLWAVTVKCGEHPAARPSSLVR